MISTMMNEGDRVKPEEQKGRRARRYKLQNKLGRAKINRPFYKDLPYYIDYIDRNVGTEAEVLKRITTQYDNEFKPRHNALISKYITNLDKSRKEYQDFLDDKISLEEAYFYLNDIGDHYENLKNDWVDWLLKADNMNTDKKYRILDGILFHLCENKKGYLFKKITPDNKEHIRNRCEQLGIKHETLGRKNKRELTVKVPKNWIFTDPLKSS